LLDPVRPRKQDEAVTQRPPKPNKILFLLLALACLATLASLPGARPAQGATAKGDLTNHYAQAKQYSQEVTDSPALAAERQNWLTAIKNFRDIYQADQAHPLAPACLFMMARLYRTMHGRFKNPLDLSEAAAYYEDIVALYANDRLADDALLALADIYLAERQSPDKAARLFNRLLKTYPAGDMAPAAAGALARITGNDRGQAPVLLSASKKTPISHAPAAVAAGGPGTGMASLKPLRHWSNNNYTRVVIETTSPVKYRENLLKKTANAPRRLYIDLENCRIAPELQDAIPINDGLLKRVRSGQYAPDITRVVLDTQSLSDYKIFSLQEPFRIVIDLKGQNSPDPQSAPPAVLLATDAKAAVRTASITVGGGSPPSLAQQLGLGIRRIVLDPGHGGKDSGARGKGGVMEKDIVLKVARQLARKLREKLGCEVVMTRDSDVFIPLEERTAIANSKEGDLFISIHVNAAPNNKARGIETYILDLARSKNAMELAARENSTSTSQISNLQTILLDLIQNSKKSESIKLAEYVQDHMVNGLRPRYPIKNLGVKQAPFVVLVGAQMPAILIEIAFLSNPTEAKWLQSDDYIGRVSDQLLAGISGYTNELNFAYLAPR
jgi:N-acetylmuramoyl-L-alanine amidase